MLAAADRVVSSQLIDELQKLLALSSDGVARHLWKLPDCLVNLAVFDNFLSVSEDVQTTIKTISLLKSWQVNVCSIGTSKSFLQILHQLIGRCLISAGYE